MPLTSSVDYIAQNLDSVCNDSYSTRIGPAIEFCPLLFDMSQKERGESVRKVVVVVSDGYIADIDPTPKDEYYGYDAIGSANNLKASGVSIFCIQIEPVFDSNMKDMLMLATDPNHYFKSDYKSLSETLSKLDPCM